MDGQSTSKLLDLVLRKMLKFLKNNFQLVNFFVAALLVGMLYGWWYLPNSKHLSVNEESAIHNQEKIAVNNSLENRELSSLPVPTPSPTNLEPLITGVPETQASPLLPELPSDYEQLSPPVQQQILEEIPNNVAVKTNLGHYPFSENTQQRLVKVGEYYGRSESLDQEAATAFKRMQADAQVQGVRLTIISGFRSIASQDALFQNQIKRKGGKEAAARFSAPPGHSEHHTGYALDIGDGANPANDLKISFENTSAYQWLVRNANKYGFELSFPPGNSQGVSYEPWHWRYVNSPRANQIFMAARSGI
ncbi:M15 family metallopeptidase [Synechocystis salina LEGE 00031]|uniref:M15 family metallopeptidase n=2 Tax=Synechocystis TaxID=1142 RepID=A0ABR9VRK3_9SYNC|nr:M15 family metallopeptidase [Synechocystis salina LEGE 00041]MBE9253979.1 M15 family metallopeptidase [Synechocystis salina LEGE 00031]